MDIFISYKHQGSTNNSINEICQNLKKAGIKYFIDNEQLSLGDNIVNYENSIGKAQNVLMIVTPEYLKSIQCMYEMACVWDYGNVEQRVVMVAELGDLMRSNESLKHIKQYWEDEKIIKLKESFSNNSSYLAMEIEIITLIIEELDKFWKYVTNNITSSIEDICKDGSVELIKRLNKVQEANINAAISRKTESSIRENSSSSVINQFGERSIVIQNNNGIINIT